MQIPDYYANLGVTAGAAPAEIKNAYRKLAKQYHPDSYRGDDAAGAEAKFKQASEA
jgi:DnaJ-class molecular chaperone